MQTTHQQIHTKSYTKAWHKVLKAHYLLKMDAKKPPSCPPLPTPPQANVLSLTKDKIRFHLENLAASMPLALKGANKVLKFVKNQRQITTELSPDWMWWFKEACKGIMGQVLHGCPNAPTPRKAAEGESPPKPLEFCFECESITGQRRKDTYADIWGGKHPFWPFGLDPALSTPKGESGPRQGACRVIRSPSL
ncbi:hypothetical protein PtB15_9B355 [Puccinia triticina]|nr:hypothetical protein PtB15_9B355 [Puccinia triticina]